LLLIITATLTAQVSAQTAKPSATPLPHPEVHRWFDVELLTLSTRYRFVENANGQTANDQQQWQFQARTRFKFDRNAKYSVVAQFGTGHALTSGWNNTGLGSGDPQENIYPKLLYFDAKPVKPLEIQVGGIAPNNGENTEITGYDNDTYIMGERVVIRAPKSIYFDEVSVTNAFIGDQNTPDVFRRFRHLDRSDYHQLLVRKKVNSRVGFSADYTFESGIDTLRQAVKVNTPELKFADSLLYENYERIDPDAGYGFALIGYKHVNKKIDLSGGFVKISHVMFNSDRFPRGERLYFNFAYKLTHELTINPVIIQAVGPLHTPTTPRTRFEIIASYNILEAFHHYHVY
jgi:hypothetical protein